MASDQALRSMLISYQNSNAAFTDVRNAVASFKDLRPQMKQFTYSNGQTKNLLALEGTIPITYKTKVYNIPLILWLHEVHPQNAPMVYVQPTSTMNVKAGPHVESNGTVRIPYLSEWRQGSHDLTTLISVLCMQFGESPPVFAKPKNQPAQAIPHRSAALPGSQPPAHPPYPPTGGGMPTPYPPTSNTGYPAAPNYNNTGSSGYPSNQTPQGYNPYGPPSSSSSSPPYPPHPQQTTTTSAIGGYPGMYGTGSGYNSSPSGYNPYQTSNSAYPNQGSSQSTPPYPPTQTNNNSGATYPASGYNPYSSSSTPNTYNNPAASAASSVASQPMGRQSSFGLSEDQIKQSMLSAVQDKMRRKVKDIFQTHNAEMDVLKKTQTDLTNGQSQLDTMEQTIHTETAELEQAISYLETKIPSLRDEIEKRQTDEVLPPEDAIETTAPLYRQLLQCHAEEQAIEDTLYILGDSLRHEVITIELYLKKVRALSRKQFMLRATIVECRKKAGLSDVYS